jgi:hypothetical protein
MLGYYIGYALLETVGQWIISLYGMQDGPRGSRTGTGNTGCG